MSNIVSVNCSIPIYVVKSLGNYHLVVAGGGGSSKTGVSNKIMIYEIVPTKKSCEFVQSHEIEVDSDAIMTGALISSLDYDTSFSSKSLFATAGSPTNKLRLHNIEITSPNPTKSDVQVGVESVAIENVSLDKDGYKCVSNRENTLIVGGMNGSVTIWPDIKNQNLFSKFHAFSGEIDEIDAHPDGIRLVILSRSKGFIVWDMLEKKKLFERAESFRSCKFSPTITKKSAHLYTVSNQVKAPSKLIKWDTINYKLIDQLAVGSDAIMALAISKDDKYIGLGTASGAVHIHNTSNLKQIYSVKKAHNIFVTSLEFLPHSPESKILTNTDTCSLVSVSVDHKVMLHRPLLGYGIISRILIFLLIYIVYEIFINLI